ncbi:glucose-6-phosphate isomerase [Bartonella sp. HY329]|uniref:glucose-6-phosphate isomerase n=1 Tax=unclassified Bartonella TaxID=2645622 RepID=UPI0021CA312F|nr:MULTISPECIES: glucose-6-phosphate isomerase [unclassified Bartonella]UXM95912.1 glucose-6-phosphate isomerase [Bartonella sp. HY329]UXN10237.1 glucose-6-phosphate isomerase [Bartonella sp. HY328]
MARDAAQFDKALTALKAYAENDASFDIRALFQNDPQRFEKFSLNFEDLLFDYSKTALSQKALCLLDDLAHAADIVGHRDAMYRGDQINITEKRAVLHIALRMPEDSKIILGDKNIVEDVHDVLNRMAKFSTAVRDGDINGSGGKAFTDIVNIGIGGSDLGPRMATAALKPYHDGPRCHFVSNVDGANIADVLKPLDPAATLIIISSKTFTTAETMTNARVARQWICNALGEEAVAKHFAAVSTALDKVSEFGIDHERTFGFWNWVGGRYSIWSAIGLSLMLAIGAQQFRKFLAGAHAMDMHFKDAPLNTNLPMMLGLVGYWHRVICNYPARAIIPYEERLQRFPAYLQQLDMESNGKHIDLNGMPVTTPTGPLVWGEPGTNAQHAFFQLLHQGTDIIPIEFIVAVNGHEPKLQRQHDMLLANCLAQSEALMVGKGEKSVCDELEQQGMSKNDAENLCPHKEFDGNRPTLTLMQDLLTPYALGRLIALYEHRVFVEGVLMNINSFDQWGVELGKALATELLPMVSGEKKAQNRDASTLGLLAHIQSQRNKS